MPYETIRGFELADAIAAGKLAKVRELIDADLIDEPVHSSFEDLRALHIAALNAHPDVCEYLLSLGADPSIVAGVTQLTPLHCALDRAQTIGRAKSNAKCCELLLAAGAPTGVFSRGHQTPLHRAIGLIISDPMRHPNLTEPTPIEQASMNIIAMLIARGANPSIVPDGHERDLRSYLTPFQYVVEKNKEQVLRLMLHTCNIDLGQRTLGGKTLLQLAKKQAAKDLLRSTKVVRQMRDALEQTSVANDVAPRTPGMSPL